MYLESQNLASAHDIYADSRLDTLAGAVGKQIAQQFFWQADTDTIQTYEHRLTCRYIHVDRVSGQFYNQQRVPISAESALKHAMPSLTVARWDLLLAPMLPEPDLGPFMRCYRDRGTLAQFPGASSVTLGSGRLRGLCSGLFQRLRVTSDANGTHAIAAPATQSRVEVARLDGHSHDICLSAFTRRTA